MGRIRSALQQLYSRDDVWQPQQPAVQSIPPEPQELAAEDGLDSVDQREEASDEKATATAPDEATSPDSRHASLVSIVDASDDVAATVFPSHTLRLADACHGSMVAATVHGSMDPSDSADHTAGVISSAARLEVTEQSLFVPIVADPFGGESSKPTFDAHSDSPAAHNPSESDPGIDERAVDEARGAFDVDETTRHESSIDEELVDEASVDEGLVDEEPVDDGTPRVEHVVATPEAEPSSKISPIESTVEVEPVPDVDPADDGLPIVEETLEVTVAAEEAEKGSSVDPGVVTDETLAAEDDEHGASLFEWSSDDDAADVAEEHRVDLSPLDDSDAANVVQEVDVVRDGNLTDDANSEVDVNGDHAPTDDGVSHHDGRAQTTSVDSETSSFQEANALSPTTHSNDESSVGDEQAELDAGHEEVTEETLPDELDANAEHVLNLVQQVLGISPNAPFTSDDAAPLGDFASDEEQSTDLAATGEQTEADVSAADEPSNDQESSTTETPLAEGSQVDEATSPESELEPLTSVESLPTLSSEPVLEEPVLEEPVLGEPVLDAAVSEMSEELVAERPTLEGAVPEAAADEAIGSSECEPEATDAGVDIPEELAAIFSCQADDQPDSSSVVPAGDEVESAELDVEQLREEVEALESIIEQSQDQGEQTPDGFHPVMQTWANIASTSELQADASPPVSGARRLEEGPRSKDSLADELIPDTGNVNLSSANSASTIVESIQDDDQGLDQPPIGDAQDVVFEEPEFLTSNSDDVVFEEDADELSELPTETPVDDDTPAEVISDTGEPASDNPTPARSALRLLPEKTVALPFERTMAERILESSFGEHVQQLSERIHEDLANRPAVLLFASLETDEQRASIVAALAMHICGGPHSRTLLIDADVSNGWISQQYEQAGAGIANVLTEDLPWYKPVVATSCPNLRLMSAGQWATDVDSENLQQTVQRVLEESQDAFDLIVLDGGALDNGLLPYLAPLADGTYLSVRLGADDRDQLSRGVDFLAELGADVKGCITTGPDSDA